ncbi:MAG TPA: FkbM family methyltransferase [Candidatus Paceibacterota bacterium]|nr:FkbM family methyltransferase [Candidatus Paceibacterota bacterium]
MNKNFNNIDIEEKRKIFLEELSKHEKDILEFEKFSGPGIKRKIQRLIYSPKNYLPYISRKIFRNFFNDKTIKLFYGKELLIDNKDDEASRLVEFKTLGGEAELRLTKFFIKNLDQGDIFYDIGANYGFYTCLAAEFCKEVHLFEPIPFVFDNLKDNLKDYQNVFLNNLALSDKKGKIDLFMPDVSGSSSIVKEVTQVQPYQFKQKIEVEADTLENYFKSHNFPSVIKLDVEGAESLVIEGGLEFFKNNSPIISLEVWSPKEGGRISMKAVEKLRNLGYQSYLINKNGELEKADGDLSIIVEKEGKGHGNFIFKK